MDFHSNTVVNRFLSNIILPIDEEKLNAMTYSELNQFACAAEYKVCTIVISFSLVLF